jgi:hypothetical protein
MRTRFDQVKWLPALVVTAGIALLGLPRSAHAVVPTERVTVVVTNPTTGNILATGTFDSGLHTGPPGQTPPFSPNSTQITTGFTSPGLAGVTSTGGQHTADNNYPDVTSPGIGQYLESIVNNVSNTNSSTVNVTLVVSANNFTPVTAADTLASVNVSGSFTSAAGSSITASWFEDNGNRISSVTGTAGSAPVSSIFGTQTATPFSFTAPDNQTDSFSRFTPNIPVNFTNPFSMTLVIQETLTSGAVLTNRTQSQLAVPGVPEPSTMALAALGAMGFVGYGLRRRKARAA